MKQKNFLFGGVDDMWQPYETKKFPVWRCGRHVAAHEQKDHQFSFVSYPTITIQPLVKYIMASTTAPNGGELLRQQAAKIENLTAIIEGETTYLQNLNNVIVGQTADIRNQIRGTRTYTYVLAVITILYAMAFAYVIHNSMASTAALRAKIAATELRIAALRAVTDASESQFTQLRALNNKFDRGNYTKAGSTAMEVSHTQGIDTLTRNMHFYQHVLQSPDTMRFSGYWDAIRPYQSGDIVVEGTEIHVAAGRAILTSPSENPQAWVHLMSIRIDSAA